MTRRSRPIAMSDIDQALHRLQTDYLDAMLLHSYDFDLLLQGDALEVLKQHVKRQNSVYWLFG